MTRFRVTVRGNSMELRGYVDGEHAVRAFAELLFREYGTDPLVVVSPVDDGYNPFHIPSPSPFDAAIRRKRAEQLPPEEMVDDDE